MLRRFSWAASHVLTALFAVVLGIGGLAWGAPATLVQILNGASVVSASNGLPVDCVSGCSGGGGGDVNITGVGGNPVTTTVPVSGTVVLGTGSDVIGHVIVDSGTLAASQSGSWTVAATQLGSWNVGQSGAPWEVEGSGTAGTPTGGVITVQGDASGEPIPVDCVTGCSGGGGGTSSAFGDSFPADGTASGFTNSSTGAMVGATVDDASGGLNVNVVNSGDIPVSGTVIVGNTGGASAVNIQDGGNSITVDNGGTFAVQAAQSGGWTFSGTGSAGSPASGVVTVQGIGSGTAVKVDGTGGVFPISGAVSNASSGVTTTSTNVPTVGYLYGFNGTSWDQLQVDASKFLKVILQTGSNVIGAVTQSGTWTVQQGGSPWGVTGSGTAGSPASGVVTVQGIPSGSPVAGNVTFLGSNAINLGAGSAGTGTQRVLLATDQAALAAWGLGATGSAVPSGGQYQAANIGGNLTGLIACDSVAKYDASTSGSTQLVALTSSQTIRVCGYTILAAGTVNVKLVYGTGSNCATSPSDITPAFQLTAQAGLVDRAPYWQGLATAASNALCINASAAVAVQALVYYTKF